MLSFTLGCEHEPLNLDEHSEATKERISKLAASGRREFKTLGLYCSRNGGICPGNYIGAVWVGEDDVLRVNSKFNKPKMDYMKMFVECYEDSVIGERMSNSFDCWPEQKLITLSDADDFSIMVVIAFLRELNTLCVRHLRRHFKRRRENFIGKVKGKILIGENMRRNVVCARPDRIFCEYQAISDDILENRILRAALERAARYISRDKIAEKHECVHRWIHACRAHLQGVSVTHISRRQFAVARKRGMFAFYRRPLNLAKAVLCRFGLNPHEEINESTQTPPYAIDSAELFERYAQLQLLNKHPNLKALYERAGSIRGEKINVRPDFYVPHADGEAWIIDAKYKDLSKKKQETEKKKPYSTGDLYQVVAYSRHSPLLERINCEDKEKADDIKLSLVYPHVGEVSEKDKLQEVEKINDFLSPITIYKISCPVVKEKPPEESSSQ